jgi:hypothetical protein
LKRFNTVKSQQRFSWCSNTTSKPSAVPYRRMTATEEKFVEQ